MKISIIIPIYNVEQYITACLKSVEVQTYTDYEVILVDDCGTDGSMEIVDDYVNDYRLQFTVYCLHDSINTPKWRVIKHDRNRGLSAARNTGTKEAKGEYIYYLDSDDTITPDCLEKLVAEAERTDAEMVVGGIHIIGNSKGIPTLKQQDTLFGDDCFHGYLNGLYYVMAVNKLIRHDFIERNHIIFVEGMIHEDDAWSFLVASCMKKVAFVYDETYNYLIRPNSIQTGSDYTKHFHAYYTLLKYYAEEADKNGKTDDVVFRWWFEGMKFYYFSRTFSFGTKKQLHDLYIIIRHYMPMKGWRKTTIHYFFPSWLGIIVYKMAVYVNSILGTFSRTSTI